MIAPSGPPSRWVVDHGRPALCTGRRGMPSYEHEDGDLVVLDLLVATASFELGVMLFPRSYGIVAVIAPDGMVPLHHNPSAWWAWRPCVRRLSLTDDCVPAWSVIGSQAELGWRYGLMEIQHALYADGEFTMSDAFERAEHLLLDNLTDQQRIEYHATGNFRVCGAKTGRVYRITVNDGFDRIDPATGQTITSYCLHTEEWIPATDQALATKLALEDADLEAEVIDGARGYPRPTPRSASLNEARAARMEREWRLVA